MTTSKHRYQATLVVGGVEYPLDMRRSGDITLDENTAPHVQATLDLSLPDEALQTVLDPRLSARVRVDVDAELPMMEQERTFDLALRSRPIRRGPGGNASIRLASDEVLLNDRIAHEDDFYPFELAASARNIVNYVLGLVIPGTELEATPSIDADLTPYWETINRVLYPAADAVDGFTLGINAENLDVGTSDPLIGTAYPRFTSIAAGNTYLGVTLSDRRCAQGETLELYFGMRASTTGQTGQAHIQFRDDNDTIIGHASTVTTALPVAPDWTELNLFTQVPAGAVSFTAWVVGNATTGGVTFAADKFMCHDGEFHVPYFDGSFADDAFYTYEFTSDFEPSGSRRIPVVERDPEAFVIEAGQTYLDFLKPLLQSAGLRLVCDGHRQWTLRGEQYVAPGSITIREGVNLIDGEDTIDLDDETWFDARLMVYEWEDRTGNPQRRTDYYALNDPPLKETVVTINAPYPGPGRAEYAVRRAQGRGREVSATVGADWRANAEQAVTVEFLDAPSQSGRASRVRFDLGMDRMTVTAKTAEALPGSIDSLTGTIDSLTGTINSL